MPCVRWARQSYGERLIKRLVHCDLSCCYDGKWEISQPKLAIYQISARFWFGESVSCSIVRSVSFSGKLMGFLQASLDNSELYSLMCDHGTLKCCAGMHIIRCKAGCMPSTGETVHDHVMFCFYIASNGVWHWWFHQQVDAGIWHHETSFVGQRWGMKAWKAIVSYAELFRPLFYGTGNLDEVARDYWRLF